MRKKDKMIQLLKSCLPETSRKKLWKLKAMLKDHHEKKYISYSAAVRNWYANRDLKYEIYDLEKAKKFRTSDTIFILGSGPSLNELGQKHIKIISKHDSFGINYSYLKKEIIPTFHQFSWENDWSIEYQKYIFSTYRKKYEDVLIFFHKKALHRMAHPKTTPFFFPENAKCCLYKLPEAIILENGRSLCRKDFDKTLFYRGTLSLVLDLILTLGYKNIVLLGVDLQTPEHFFYSMPEMLEYARTQKEIHDKDEFQYMISKPGKNVPFDKYLYDLNNYLLKYRDTKLYIGFKKNMLYPGIPSFFE